jgi:hypothetical protein
MDRQARQAVAQPVAQPFTAAFAERFTAAFAERFAAVVAALPVIALSSLAA